MDTQKLNNNQAPKKKGMDASKVAMAGAGAAAAVVGGAAFVAGMDDDPQDEPVVTIDPTVEDPAPSGELDQNDILAQIQEPTQPEPQPQNVTEPTPIAPDQPGTSGDHTPETPTEVIAEVVPTDPAEAEALAIAQHLVGTDEIDAADIDAQSLAFVGTDVVYDDDGSEIPVAIVNMPDSGEPFLVADVDGDRVYDYLVDSNGNMEPLNGLLNVDDAEFALADEDYLAANEETIHLINNEDISEDVLVLDEGDLLASTDHFDGEPGLMEDGYEAPDAYDTSLADDIVMDDISYDTPDVG